MPPKSKQNAPPPADDQPAAAVVEQPAADTSPALPDLGDAVLLYVLNEDAAEGDESKLRGPYPGTVVTVSENSYFADIRVEEDGQPAWTARQVNYKGDHQGAYWERPAAAPQ